VKYNRNKRSTKPLYRRLWKWKLKPWEEVEKLEQQEQQQQQQQKQQKQQQKQRFKDTQTTHTQHTIHFWRFSFFVKKRKIVLKIPKDVRGRMSTSSSQPTPTSPRGFPFFF
jgi:hypothetical protein